MSREIFSIINNLSRYGGAQKVLIDVHEGLKNEYDSKIIGFQKFEDLHPKYSIKRSEYIQLKNPFILRNKVLLVHARNVSSFIMPLKKLLFLNTKVIYISHSVYNNYKKFSFFPNKVVSISEKVTDNLENFFGIERVRIRKIYNGINDIYNNDFKPISFNKEKIILLYSARINNGKRQIQIVKNLLNKLPDNIEIHFAGTGPDYDALVSICSGTKNFKALGFVDDIHTAIQKSAFIMLYSNQEGLPISLIEGAMHGKPLIINDIGGNKEIGLFGKNAIQVSDWNDLENKLNDLVNLPEEKYLEMCRNSRLIYEEKFRYNVMINKYKELIHEN